ncbi:MAG: radical SAM protein [Myxococcota bacterium]
MIHVKLGYACNNACLFCPYGDKRVTVGNLAADAALAAIPAAKRKNDGAGISLSGGETLLRRDLTELVRAARGRGFRAIEIQTNGRMLAYRKLAHELREAGATCALVLLLGPDAAIHDFHTRAPGSFKQTVAGIRNAVAEGIAVEVRTILTKSNYRHLGDLAAVAADLGARRLRLAFPSGVDAKLFRTLVPRLGKLASYVTAAVELGRKLGLPVETEGLPLCHAVAPVAAGAELFAKGDPPPDGWAVKGPPCAACALASRCPGLEAAYAQTYGFGELVPLPPPSPA